jgi:hypothetical protein
MKIRGLKMLSKEEKKLISGIDINEAWSTVEHLSTLDKTSGTEGEMKAHEYIREKLEEYGVKYEAIEFDSLISHPKEASLRVVSPNNLDVECITHSFSKLTTDEGIEAEMVYVPVSPSSLFTGLGNLVDQYKESDVEGKVTLMYGVASPAVVWAAQQAGAIAQIHICGGDVLHEMIVTTIWGTPTPESAERIPDITAVSVKHTDGKRLIELAKKGSVKVNLKARTDTRWRVIPFTVAEIVGTEWPDKFMLVHGHMDSWYLGTTDNCTGNAALLELARLFEENKDKLKRSIRIAWWSGHSTGRYSSSTWYADNRFHDLDRNCFLSMNIDSPGVLGASELGGGGLMGTMETIRAAAEDASGEKGIESKAYYMRAGDQSFYGIGIPSVAVRANIPEGSPHKGRWIGGSGGAWWWHSAFDTLDKGDKENLHRDIRMEALAVHRSVNSRVLPFDFAQVAEMYEKTATEIQTRTALEVFNLGPVLKRVRDLKIKAETLNKAIDGLSKKKTPAVNNLFVEISRILTSTFYTDAGPFDQDPAYGIPPIPALQEAAKLAGLNPRSDEAGFLRTKMVRETNRVCKALDTAAKLIDEATALAG